MTLSQSQLPHVPGEYLSGTLALGHFRATGLVSGINGEVGSLRQGRTVPHVGGANLTRVVGGT